MASCSTFLANKLLDHVFGKTTFTADDDLELALYSAAPNSDGSGGTELTGNNYSRIPLTNDTTTWSNASARQKLNGIVITLPQAVGGDWLAIVAWKILDSSGNVYTFGRTPAPVTVADGEIRTVPIGNWIQNLT